MEVAILTIRQREQIIGMNFTYINSVCNINYQYECISFHIGEKLLMVPA